MGRKTIKRGPGKRRMEGKDFHLADEICYIQRRAAEHDGRFVTVGSLAQFSTDARDAWLLDPEDHLAARLARDGDPEDVYFEETDARFAIGWKGESELTAAPSSTSTTIPVVSLPFSATPSAALRNGVDREISNIFG